MCKTKRLERSSKTTEFTPVFSDVVPNRLEDGRIYISLKYRTVIHKCACGCGSEINTPLHPTGWAFIYNGLSISLRPSVGNWSEECQSHYWIENNKVHWSRRWSTREILEERSNHRLEINRFFNSDDRMETDKEQGLLTKTSFVWKAWSWVSSKLLRRTNNL